MDGIYFKVVAASGLSPGSSVTCSMSSGKFLNLSKPQFPLSQEVIIMPVLAAKEERERFINCPPVNVLLLA